MTSSPSSFTRSKSPLAYYSNPPLSLLRRLTRTRRFFSYLSTFFFLLNLIFLILVVIGNIKPNATLSRIYFLKLDLSHIIPRSVPDAPLIDSIAKTLGLHDFYQVGLWNFCEGYGEEITYCSKPKTLYWFNPIDILLNELLAGATVAIPTDITDALKLVRIASHAQFGFFIVSLPLSLLSIILAPIAPVSRLLTIPIAILCFLCAFTSTVATVIATVLWSIFQKTVEDAGYQINISGKYGNEMFAFMWIAAGSSLFGALIMVGECCCCRSRRDVRTGRKMKGKIVNGDGIGRGAFMDEKGARRRSGRGR